MYINIIFVLEIIMARLSGLAGVEALEIVVVVRFELSPHGTHEKQHRQDQNEL